MSTTMVVDLLVEYSRDNHRDGLTNYITVLIIIEGIANNKSEPRR